MGGDVLFSGLKMKIAGTLAVLLTFAILLSNIVVISFWKKGMILSEIEHVRSVLGVAISIKSQNLNQLEFYEEPQALCGYIGNRCVGLVFSGGEHWLKNDMVDLQEKCLKFAQESAVSQKEIIKFEGNPKGVPFLKKKYMLIAEPLLSDAIDEQKAVVVVIAVDSVYASIFENHKAILGYLLINVLLLTVVGFFRLINITVKPIERMIRMSKSYQDSDVLFFSGEEKLSEFGQLSMALNGMLQRIESDREKLRKTVLSLESANLELLKTQKEMIRAEKIASV
jgi:two-component system NtrC family sensor kinase